MRRPVGPGLTMPPVSFETITLEVDGDGLAHLMLNRPEAANALNPLMAAELRHAAVGLAHDSSVRAVLLTATGRVFCGGGDLASFATVEQAALPAHIDDLPID